MERASLIQDMKEFGLRFHHAFDETAVLSIWLLQDSESKIPEFATHNVGVGAVVVNSRDEILLVRELRKNYTPWKTPTGLTELGEQLDEAATREVSRFVEKGDFLVIVKSKKKLNISSCVMFCFSRCWKKQELKPHFTVYLGFDNHMG